MSSLTSNPCCVRCSSARTHRHGQTRFGKQRYRCAECAAAFVDAATAGRYSEERKAEILRACTDGASLRAVERIFGVARQTVAVWLKKNG